MTDEKKAAKAAAQKRWYEKNKQKHIANVAARKKEVATDVVEFVRALKENTPCTDCGVQYPYYVMDFDHLRDKKQNIAHMVTKGYRLETVQEEIDKCEIVCANCHRIRTYNRMDQ